MTTKTKVFTKTATSEIISIYLSEEIGFSDTFVDEFRALEEAVEGDEINIYINCHGGYLHTAIQWIVKITQCRGTVIAHLEGECASAATLIFLACDGWVVHDTSRMMFHNYSGGGYGKGEDLVQQVVENDKWYANVMNQSYKDFLYKKELKKLKREDIYLDREGIMERLENLVKHRQLEEESLRLEQVESLKKQANEMA